MIYHLSYLAYEFAVIFFGCAVVFPIYMWKERTKYEKQKKPEVSRQ